MELLLLLGGLHFQGSEEVLPLLELSLQLCVELDGVFAGLQDGLILLSDRGMLVGRGLEDAGIVKDVFGEPSKLLFIFQAQRSIFPELIFRLHPVK